MCDAKRSDQSGRITLLDHAVWENEHSFQHGDWELSEEGLTWCQTCGQKALCCAASVVEAADSTGYFYLGQLIFHSSSSPSAEQCGRALGDRAALALQWPGWHRQACPQCCLQLACRALLHSLHMNCSSHAFS